MGIGRQFTLQKAVTGIALMLLLFNGISALYGGLQLIIYPDGSSLGMPAEYLKYSLFSNYLIPGIILLTVNGFLSLSITALTLARVSHYSLAIMAQGTLLLGWIIIQVLLLRFTFVLHFVMGAAGLLLIAIGYYLFRYNKRKDLLLNSTGF